MRNPEDVRAFEAATAAVVDASEAFYRARASWIVESSETAGELAEAKDAYELAAQLIELYIEQLGTKE